MRCLNSSRAAQWRQFNLWAQLSDDRCRFVMATDKQWAAIAAKLVCRDFSLTGRQSLGRRTQRVRRAPGHCHRQFITTSMSGWML